MSIYKDISIHLTNNNIKNHSIGQHQGKCTSPFVVIDEVGEFKEKRYTLKVKDVDIVVYYPVGKYSEMDNYINQVIKAMESYTRATFTHNISDVMIEDDKGAYVVILSYKLYKGI